MWLLPALPALVIGFGATRADESRGPFELDQLRALIARGRYAEAESGARELLAEVERARGAESLATAEVLDVLVESRLRDGRIYDTQSRELAERSVRLKEKLLGPGDPGIAISLLNLAGVVRAIEGPRAARPLCERAVSMAADAEEDVVAARALAALADALSRSGEAGEAKRLFERAIEIQQRELGERDLRVADTLHLLGWHHYATGDYAAAASTFERTCEIVEREYGSQHPDLGRSLAALGLVVSTRGDLARAQPLLERALAIAEHNYGTEHALVASILTSLAKLHASAGRVAEAERIFRQALSLREAIQGPEHFALIPTLNGLGWLLYGTGEYREARTLYERALSITERHYGADQASAGWILCSYGNLLRRTGDHAAARSAFEQAVRIAESDRGNESLLAASLLNLAYLEQVSGHLGRARELYERVLPLLRERFGPEHEWVLECLSVYGGLLVDMGDLAGARAMLERALELREKVLGPGHVAVADTLRSLAMLLLKTGDFSGARRLSERAVVIDEAALGPDAPRLGWSVRVHSEALLRTGEPRAAMAASLRAERIARNSLHLTLTTMPERAGLAYASQNRGALNVALSVLALGGDHGGPAAARAVWDCVLRSRALVLDELAARHRSVARSDDPEIARLAAQLFSTRTRLAGLTTGGPGAGGPVPYSARIGDVREEKERIERLLAEKSAEFREDQTRKRIGLTEVAAALPPGSALAAYVLYRRSVPHDEHERTTSPRKIRSYLALVLGPDAERVTAIPLGPADAIDDLVRSWKAQAAADPSGLKGAAARAEARFRRAGVELRRAIWDPVAQRIADAERVFVVPAGALHLVSLQTLPAGEDRYLVEDGPLLHYLSAERDLVPGRKQGHGEALLALGGPDFDAGPVEVEAAASERSAVAADPELSAEVPRQSLYRSPPPSCSGFLAEPFSPLPRARIEATDIGRLWKKSLRSPERKNVDVLTLTGAEANERAFKLGASGRRIIHLATHGFFVQGSCRSLLAESAGNADEPVGDNPMLLSGLALAGANRRWEIEEGAEDGILTAEEIASLDLSGTEWAVLSGCETGLGKLQVGEGVLGLRRAFQIAGARTLIMSLWQVEDEAARAWMRRLYEGRLSGLSTAESVRRASLEVLSARRKNGKSGHPFYWGGFVAAGDWR